LIDNKENLFCEVEEAGQKQHFGMGDNLGLGRENRFDRVQESENHDERQK
jgi:hypothetical protein